MGDDLFVELRKWHIKRDIVHSVMVAAVAETIICVDSIVSWCSNYGTVVEDNSGGDRSKAVVKFPKGFQNDNPMVISKIHLEVPIPLEEATKFEVGDIVRF